MFPDTLFKGKLFWLFWLLSLSLCIFLLFFFLLNRFRLVEDHFSYNVRILTSCFSVTVELLLMCHLHTPPHGRSPHVWAFTGAPTTPTGTSFTQQPFFSWDIWDSCQNLWGHLSHFSFLCDFFCSLFPFLFPFTTRSTVIN